MGKSPARWIKTLLFGKKSRSHATKGRDALKTAHDKGFDDAKDPSLAANSPVISEPLPTSTENNGVILTSDKGKPSDTGGSLPVISHMSQGVIGSTASEDTNNGVEEQAAIKAQAAFRGFLARRAFRALKGIIRLQALIRGHLVRRQAVATLRAMEGIIKLQAVARGRKVRSSFTHLNVTVNFKQENTLEPITQDSWQVKFSSNAFVSKLLASAPLPKPLQIQYDQGDPNSVFSWLERWTTTGFWQPVVKSKKPVDLKVGSNQVNRESGKSRRTMRNNPASNCGSGQTNTNSEPEKTKRNQKKVHNSTAEAAQEHPQSELERVKRNLRKISTSVKDASEQPDTEARKSDLSLKKVSATGLSEDLGQGIEESMENPKINMTPMPSLKRDTENSVEPVVSDVPVDVLIDDKSSKELESLQQMENVENTLVVNEDLSLNDEQLSHETERTSKRRSSLTKSEYPDNGLPNIPVLPSYMAATESAKAKLRGQISPRLVTEPVDKSGFTRRHSLPSSTNGKMSSPRPKRLSQAGAKGGINRDVNEKPIQVGWRR